MLVRNFFTICLLFLTTIILGQDVHFTQFTYAPQSYNPSLIGAYAGTFRAAGIYRTQYNNSGNNAAVKGFNTLEINVDAPIIKGFRDQDWVGVGVSFDQDTRGQYVLRDNITRLGASYHLGLDKKSTSYFSVGLQYVISARSIDADKALMDGRTTAEIVNSWILNFNDNDRMNNFTSSGGSGNNDLTGSFNDFVLGVSYSAKSKKGNFKIGLAGSQFLQNNVTFKDDVDDPFKLVGFFQMFRLVNKKLAIEPALLFQSVGNGQGFEISGNNMFSYKIKDDSDLRIKAGFGARTGTFSAQALVGASLKGFYGGLAYDIPFGGYQGATQWQDAIEFAIGYIGVISKKPKAKPIILCPRL